MSGNSAGWVASGGAYFILFGQTLLVATFSILNALRIGRALRVENDGCLLAIGNLVAAFLGMGIGYFCAPYPLYLLSALLGSLSLPTVLTLLFLRKYRPS